MISLHRESEIKKYARGECKKNMEKITSYMKQRQLIDIIEDYLRNICGYGYKDRLENGKGKPELIFQSKIQELLEDKYKAENPCSIDTSILAVRPTLNEQQWEIDLKVSNEDVLCYIEMKYDELKDNGSSTNPQSENEILRDIYKLQCIKRTFPHALCLVIFGTNNSAHWEEFTHVQAGEYTIPYEGKDETFKLLSSYTIDWQEPLIYEDEGYKYFILEI